MSEIVEGLGGSEREQGRFFWIDLCVGDLPGAELGEALGIGAPALRPLLEFERGGPPSRRLPRRRPARRLPLPLLFGEGAPRW